MKRLFLLLLLLAIACAVLGGLYWGLWCLLGGTARHPSWFWWKLALYMATPLVATVGLAIYVWPAVRRQDRRDPPRQR